MFKNFMSLSFSTRQTLISINYSNCKKLSEKNEPLFVWVNHISSVYGSSILEKKYQSGASYIGVEEAVTTGLFV